MKRTIIIAEAGVNHNGDINIAKKMALVAKKAGADIVKYQTADVDSLVSKHAEMAQYQKKNTGKELSQKEFLKNLQLTREEFIELNKYCEEIGIEFLSTPFDCKSIAFLNELSMKTWKIPSGEITNLPYLVEVAKTKKPIILSTGMSTLAEVEESIKVLKKNGAGDIILLHCTTDYPTKYEDVNLKAMLTMRNHFDVEVGYSDHTRGIEVPIAAVAMGATVIEKHFTLDRTMPGPDHKASLEPSEFEEMVTAIRNIERALGTGKKEPALSEIANINIARKSIVAKKKIEKGTVLTEELLTTKRPGNGLSPMRWFEVLGTIASRDFEEDDLIEL